MEGVAELVPAQGQGQIRHESHRELVPANLKIDEDVIRSERLEHSCQGKLLRFRLLLGEMIRL